MDKETQEHSGERYPQVAGKAEPLCHMSHGECRHEGNDSSVIPQDLRLCICSCVPTSLMAGGHL